MQRKLEEAVSIDKKISFSFKVAIISEILGKDERQRYNELVNMLRYYSYHIRYKFSDVTKKELTLIKYL